MGDHSNDLWWDDDACWDFSDPLCRVKCTMWPKEVWLNVLEVNADGSIAAFRDKDSSVYTYYPDEYECTPALTILFGRSNVGRS